MVSKQFSTKWPENLRPDKCSHVPPGPKRYPASSPFRWPPLTSCELISELRPELARLERCRRRCRRETENRAQCAHTRNSHLLRTTPDFNLCEISN
ncbi:hypothetical protein Mapa_013349 [Marchantia paleacea]|nr:hypothetical protein Mapa_013349 [Marchantia paleacea]